MTESEWRDRMEKFFPHQWQPVFFKWKSKGDDENVQIIKIPELFGGRLKIFDIELEKLLRFVSPRLNGSYDELGVNWGGVVAELFVVTPFFDPSIAFFRAFTKRCSLSMSSKRLLSTSSSDSSLTGNSASICCFKIRNSWKRK